MTVSRSWNPVSADLFEKLKLQCPRIDGIPGFPLGECYDYNHPPFAALVRIYWLDVITLFSVTPPFR